MPDGEKPQPDAWRRLRQASFTDLHSQEAENVHLNYWGAQQIPLASPSLREELARHLVEDLSGEWYF